MSDLHLSEAELALYEDTRRIAQTELKPIADAGEPGLVNRPLIKALADNGLLAQVVRSGRQRDRALPDPRGAGP